MNWDTHTYTYIVVNHFAMLIVKRKSSLNSQDSPKRNTIVEQDMKFWDSFRKSY